VTGCSVGIDVGGTFTDLVAIDSSGRAEARKVLSTPADQSDGVISALDALGAREVARIVHGTTVATNTLLERTGARVVLCATAGATDLLELRRQDRASLYDLARHHPPPLAPLDRCVAVHARLGPHGVISPLTSDECQRVAARVSTMKPDAIAISLLHAYSDATHELQLASALAARLPAVDVVRSSDVLPEIREFERTATTVAEAYLRPSVTRYLGALQSRLAARALPSPAVMTSAAGMVSAADGAHHAASLALSGPAGGVAGAAAVARAAGITDALTIDIGGTSADAGIVLDGEPLSEAGGDVAGVPIALPRVLVETVSAGGGSLGWVDDGGALRVGPRSAGAVPGPAAFGRGGTQATITDAHVVLGNLTSHRLSGGVSLDAERAQLAIAALARMVNATPERTARAMIAAADASMARALRRVSVERGTDPRRCALIAIGGGGPLHACALAELLGMRQVMIPPFAGVLSALGLALAPERRERLASVMRQLTQLGAEELSARANALRITGQWSAERWWARTRYEGQGHELDVELAPGVTPQALGERFTAAHASRYGFVLEREIQIVGLRYAALGPTPTFRPRRPGKGGGRTSTVREDDAKALDATVCGRVVIALPDATLLVAEGWTARALPIGGWMMERT
jgi:N-methylhydantoinase A